MNLQLHYDTLLECQKKIDYSFNDLSHLELALRHRSLTGMKGEENDQNERLEFLGDAVLDSIVAEFLYFKYPNYQEGQLSKSKSILVNRKTLAEAIKKFRFNEYIMLSDGEENTGGRTRISILANVYEAILGAIFIDGGINQAKKFVQNTLLKFHEDILQNKEYINYKSRLLEYCQGKFRTQPFYQVVDEQGPDHEKIFTVRAIILKKVLGEGQGNSKKIAQQLAAREALISLGVIFEES